MSMSRTSINAREIGETRIRLGNEAGRLNVGVDFKFCWDLRFLQVSMAGDMAPFAFVQIFDSRKDEDECPLVMEVEFDEGAPDGVLESQLALPQGLESGDFNDETLFCLRCIVWAQRALLEIEECDERYAIMTFSVGQYESRRRVDLTPLRNLLKKG